MVLFHTLTIVQYDWGLIVHCRLWLQDLQRSGGFGAAVVRHRSRRSPGPQRGGRGRRRPGLRATPVWTSSVHVTDLVTTPTGSDVRLCQRRNGGMHASHHRPGPQAQRQDGRVTPWRNAPVAPTRFQNSGHIRTICSCFCQPSQARKTHFHQRPHKKLRFPENHINV